MSHDANTQHRRLRIILEGAVQGFGLRPTVYRVAQSLRLTGFVRNVDAAVEIEIQGSSERIDRFLSQLDVERPAGAVVTTDSIVRVASLGNLWFEIPPDIKGVSTSCSESTSTQSRAVAYIKSQDDR
jgi:hydrogenase maturation protein HypF